MGNVFPNLDDLTIVRRLLKGVCAEIEYGDEDVIDNQVGRSIVIDDTFELYAYKTTEEYKIIGGTRTRDIVAWHLVASHVVHSCRWDEPDDFDEFEIGTNMSFEDAILAVIREVYRWGVTNDLEAMMYENIKIEDELHPEEAWPQPDELLTN